MPAEGAATTSTPELLLPPEQRADRLAQLEESVGLLPALALRDHEYWDLVLLVTGAYDPLRGYLSAADYQSVMERCRLADGTLWSIPIGLSVGHRDAEELSERSTLVLVRSQEAGEEFEERAGRKRLLRWDPSTQRPLALVHVEEVFEVDPTAEAESVFGTADSAHPGVARLLAEGRFRVAGRVEGLAEFPPPHPGYPFTPAQVRAALEAAGWKTVVAFQTRNPIHRAHEYLCKCALETVDGLLIHPVVGTTKDDDVPADVRMRCYEALVANYFPKNRVLVACFPSPMRYAGPREALHHALVRRNYGATHFIIGRDHAGVGDYYGTYEAQEFVGRFDPAELGIQPLFFEHAFYCHACESMATSKTCGHASDFHAHLSGTKVRAMLRNGEQLPSTFTRPEVAAVLAEAYGSQHGRQSS